MTTPPAGGVWLSGPSDLCIFQAPIYGLEGTCPLAEGFSVLSSGWLRTNPSRVLASSSQVRAISISCSCCSPEGI